MRIRFQRDAARALLAGLLLCGVGLGGAWAPTAARAQSLPDAGWWAVSQRAAPRGRVSRVTEHDGQLVLNGTFLDVSGKWQWDVLRFDGTDWVSMRGHLRPEFTGWCTWRGQFLAGLQSQQLRVWHDGDWQYFGPPVPGRELRLGPTSIEGRLFVASNAGVFEWNGTGWTQLGESISDCSGLVLLGTTPVIVRRYGPVVRLEAGRWRELGPAPDYLERLLVVGSQLLAGGTTSTWQGDRASYSSRLYRWNGDSWIPYGDRGPGRFAGLLAVDGQVVAASSIEGTSCQVSTLLRLEGNAWVPWGDPVGGQFLEATPYRGGVLATGNFDIAGQSIVEGVACLEGDTWRPLEERRIEGANEEVRALLPWRGGLVAAGSFSGVGGEVRPGIAFGDGAQWQALGEGTDDGVFALAEYRGELVAGGDFTHAGDAAAAHVARWDGTAWQPLGNGLDERVEALASYGDALYAGGWFTHSGGTVCRGIARWDGAAWQPVGGGVDGKVSALTVYQDRLVAGGDFRKAGGEEARYLATWDGSAWRWLWNGPNAPVFALHVWRDQLAVGGMFTRVGDAPAGGLALWRDYHWEPLGDPWSYRLSVRSLATWQGALAMGFDVGSIPDAWSPGNFAVWDGTRWQMPETPAPGRVDAIASLDGGLVIGGLFSHAGGHPALNLARWDGALVSAPLAQSAAFRSGTTASIRWQSPGASNHTGYEIFRQVGAGERVKLGAVAAQVDGSYSFEDPAPVGEAADYWLRELGPLGDAQWLGPIALPALPVGLVLGAPTPNPFRQATTLTFTLSGTGAVRATVHDVQGRLVRTLLGATLTPGTYTQEWDGRDDAGAPAASGAYWMRMEAADGASARRVLLAH